MSVASTVRDESASAQARAVISLSYVQTLRRELIAGRLTPRLFEDYLERLEHHLQEINRNAEQIGNVRPIPYEVIAPVAGEDRLLDERMLPEASLRRLRA